MTDYQKFEADGRFGLSMTPLCAGCECDDLGRGGMESTTLFLTEEGRAYFIQWHKATQREAALVNEMAHLKDRIAALAKAPRPVKGLRRLAAGLEKTA